MRLPATLLARLGLVRLLLGLKPPEFLPYFIERLPPEGQPLALVPRLWPEYLETAVDEFAGLAQSAAQVRAIRGGDGPPLGDKPLVVLTAAVDVSARQFGSLLDLPEAEFKQGWLELQRDLTRLSTNSSHLIADESGHGLILEQPELVVEAIRRVVEAVRAGPANEHRA